MTASTGVRALGGRAAWITADQAVSSLANALLAIVVARAVSPLEYGAFGLAFSIYSLAVALSQSTTGQTLIVRYSAADGATQERGAGTASAVAGVLGGTFGAVLAAVALLLSYPVAAALLVVGLLLPALLVQDLWRVFFVSRGTPRSAFLNDLVWTVAQAVAIGGLLLLGVVSSAWYVAAWGLSALLAALVGLRQSRVRPRLDGAWSWLRRHRDISVPSTLNVLATLGATQIAFVLTAAVGSVDDVGALRGVQTLLGPLNIVGFALSNFAVPEIVRRRLSPRGYVRAALGITGVIMAIDTAWGLVLLLLPDAVGAQILGATWTNARGAIPGMVVFTVAIGATVGAGATLRALARADLIFLTSLILGPAILVGSVVGVAVGGAAGSAWGFAAAGLVAVPPCWVLLVRAAREGPRPEASTATTDHRRRRVGAAPSGARDTDVASGGLP